MSTPPVSNNVIRPRFLRSAEVIRRYLHRILALAGFLLVLPFAALYVVAALVWSWWEER